LQRQKLLDKREIKENEEKKRRVEEDDEYKFYEQYIGNKNKLNSTVKTTNRVSKGSSTGV
jgi:hypothetical protein